MIIIFVYHSISNSNYLYSVSPDKFERQLNYLRKNFQLIKLRDLELFLAEDRSVSNNIAAITFDDGLEDNYTHAFPILKKLNVPATIFIATDFVEKTHINASGFTFRFLNWNQIKEMQESEFVDFQSHSRTHPVLTGLKEEEIHEEFSVSKNEIESQLQKQVNYLAYPKSKYNEQVKKVAEKYFSLAFGGEGIITDFKNIDKLAVPRIVIVNKIPFWKFKVMFKPFYWKLKAIKNKFYK